LNQKIFNFLEQSHSMSKVRILVYFLMFLSIICVSSCGKPSGNDSATSTSTTETTDDLDEFNDKGVGVSNTVLKDHVVKKYNTLLVFHTDDTMQTNKAYLATLALAKNAELEELKAKVLDASDASDNNAIIDTNIQIGKRMKAKLVDLSPRSDPSFYIEEMGEEEQNLNGSKEAYWNWKIEPLKKGQHQLKLSVQVILSDDDKINLPPRDILVMIFAQKVSFSGKVGNFFSNYWQWIITGILLPILIALLTNRIRQAGSDKKK